MTMRAYRWVILAAAIGVLAAGCSDNEPSEETLRMFDDTPSPEATEAPEDDPEPTPEPGAEFPFECGEVISFVRVAEIVAVPMQGLRRIYRDDFPDSPRIEQLVCSYGTEEVGDDDDNGDTDQRERPVVEVFVSLYEDAPSAAERIQLTIDNARVSGREIGEVDIHGQAVATITGSEAISYLYAVDDRTYVLTFARGVVDEPAEPVVLTQLAEELVSRAGG